jgi:predicted RNA-binding protein YlqC (UPF0109 family)
MQGLTTQQVQPQPQQVQTQPPTAPQQQQQQIPHQNPQQPHQQQNTRTSTIDVPVRILVPSESVGAIIGKGGQTIRQLTQQTRAKVDVYRGDPMAPTTALQEKVITIRGQPENCINACREILKVMKADAESKGKPSDTPLKVLAHNDYIGRIIGKQGNIINTIKKETETSVTVSSINDMSMNVERVITVKGDLENMIKALEIIHSKVKSAFENDTKTYGAQAIMMGGIPPIPLAPPAFAAASSAAAAAAAAAFNGGPSSAARFAAAAAAAAAQAQQHGHLANGHHNPHQGQNGAQPATHSGGSNGSQSGQFQNFYQPMYPQHPQQMGQFQNQGMLGQQLPLGQQGSQHGSQQHLGPEPQFMNQGPEPETVYLYIPNVAVGAIIGTKGSFIKNIIKLSGASVKITPLTPEESKNVVERQVVIIGTPDSQWKAQYYIYEKIRQERFATDENVKLRAELQVPAHIVGRIIGKSGKNVRELQRNTGATIKLPEDAALLNQQTQETDNTSNTEESTDATTGEVQKSEETEATPAATTENVAPTEPTPETTENTTTENATTESGEKKNEPESESSIPTATTPLQQQQQPNSAGFVVVRIFGTFQASQLAQRRIQALVIQSIRGYNPMDNQMVMSHRNSLNNITNHQQGFQMPMMMSTFQPRTGEFQPAQPRLNGGGNGYNRRNNRQNHQQNKNTDPAQSTKEMNGIVSTQPPTPLTNGVSNNVDESIEQFHNLSINPVKEESAPITA